MKNDDVGFSFESGNSKDLADKVIELLSNFDLVNIMSENAMKKVEEFYSAEKHYEKMLEIYQRCT